MDKTVVIGGDASLNLKIDGDVSLLTACDGQVGIITQHDSHAEYTGSYEFTPSSETQTIPIANLIASENITINPIPQTYGLVTWNGSFLTIS